LIFFLSSYHYQQKISQGKYQFISESLIIKDLKKAQMVKSPIDFCYLFLAFRHVKIQGQVPIINGGIPHRN
jgi:hypothetical protein